MRTPTIATAFYAPSLSPETDTRRYVDSELRAIATAINLLAAGHIDITYAAPEKPRVGDIRLADGTSWNPGLGAGFYGYHSGAWNKLG